MSIAAEIRPTDDRWVTEWSALGRCAGTDPDALFVQGKAQREAKVVCKGCPVVAECLADALDTRTEFGVWGGMAERERRALLTAPPGRAFLDRCPLRGEAERLGRARSLPGECPTHGAQTVEVVDVRGRPGTVERRTRGCDATNRDTWPWWRAAVAARSACGRGVRGSSPWRSWSPPGSASSSCSAAAPAAREPLSPLAASAWTRLTMTPASGIDSCSSRSTK